MRKRGDPPLAPTLLTSLISVFQASETGERIEMSTLFDQLRIALMGLLCGGGLMAIALLLAGVIRS